MSEPLSVLIIGCGRVSVKHIKAIRSLKGKVVLKGLCDARIEAAEKLKKESGSSSDVQIFEDYKTAIDTLKPNITAVTVPSGLHYEIAKYAMEHGSDLLLEKPMAMSNTQSRDIYEISRKTGRKIAMGHIYRYLPVVGLIREDIAKGLYGKVLSGSIYVRWGHGDDYYSSAAWRGTWKADGGALMNQTIHAIDLLIWLMGSEPVEASAMISRRLRNIEAEDLGMATLRLENGALASIEGSTCTDPARHMAMFTVVCEKASFSMGLDSGKAKLDLRLNGGKKLNCRYLIRQLKAEGLPFTVKSALNPHLGIYRDLADSINENEAPIADSYSGFSSVDTLMGIYRSAKEGLKVTLPLDDDFASIDMSDYNF
ncbi:MAG: Gfo/Idh/MocA family oxidoreductase [Clostridiales bacterium]|nr:Gfo/Idh/MocA family oxidoreductase [Clostridiales bacterium]